MPNDLNDTTPLLKEADPLKFPDAASAPRYMTLLVARQQTLSYGRGPGDVQGPRPFFRFLCFLRENQNETTTLILEGL